MRVRTCITTAAILCAWGAGTLAIFASSGFSAGAGAGGNGGASAPTPPSLSAAVTGLGTLLPLQVGAAYMITVSNAANAGPTSGTVTVTDPPTNFTATSIAGTGWTCTFATLTCQSSAVVAAGASFPPITVTGNVTGGLGQTVSVPLTIAGGGLTSMASSNGAVLIGPLGGPPTVALSASAAPPPQAAGTAGTIAISVSNDMTGDLPSITSFTLNGVACTTSTCGSFGSVTGTPGSGSYAVQYTPPASLTAQIVPTVTVAPSVALSGQSFPGTLSLNVYPAGVVVTVTGALNIVLPSSAAKQLVYTLYNDVGNAGVVLTLTGSGYSCQNLAQNSCGSLFTQSITTSGTTTTTTVSYTPPTAVPQAPYNRAAIQATSVADPTRLFHQNFLISATAATTPLSINYGFKFDSILTGGAAQTISANFTDTTAAKTATWQILANGSACAAPTCGTLGTPVVTSNGNAVTSTITYTPPAAVPTGPGQSAPTIMATMSANAAAVDSFFFGIENGACGTGKNSLLNGSYAFLAHGGTPTGGYVTTVGSFTADGNGNITAGVEDANRSLGAILDTVATGGTYSVGSDNRGCVTLTNSSGIVSIYRVALGAVSGSVATQGTIMGFGDVSGQGQQAAGILKLQNLSGVSASTFSGTYAFGREGLNNLGGRYASAGLITATGTGAISNLTLDYDNFGAVGTLSGGSGSYALATGAANGRGTAQTTINVSSNLVTSNYVAYVISPSDFFVLSTDPTDANHPIQSGENLLQSGSFSTASLNGAGFVFYTAEIDPSNGGAAGVVGQSQFTTNGSATVTIDENDNGVSEPEASGVATFSVAANGRITASGVILGNAPIFYLVDPTQGFIVGTDNSVPVGYVQKQTLSSFSTSTISGQFFFESRTPTTGAGFAIGTTTFTPGNPSGTAAGTFDASEPDSLLNCLQNCGNSGLQPNTASSGAYTFSSAPTAPGQGSVHSSSVGYIVSPSKFVYMQSGSVQNPNPALISIAMQ